MSARIEIISSTSLITSLSLKPRVVIAGVPILRPLVPNDRRPPMVTSGLRIGTPAITTRGFKESEVIKLVELIISILADIENQDQILLVKNQVQKLCKQFPVYNLL
jgi:glycine hydroxymethyltransferase